MSSYMTKLEFPPKPYMLFRLGKLPNICCLLLHWVLSSFVDALWEICHALKIKITYTPPTYALFNTPGVKLAYALALHETWAYAFHSIQNIMDVSHVALSMFHYCNICFTFQKYICHLCVTILCCTWHTNDVSHVS
jgi:hypothetical protein